MKLSKCCLARISVGAMYATWRFPNCSLLASPSGGREVATAYAVVAATAVLPLPTSPSRSLGIGEREGEARSEGLNVFLVCDHYITRGNTNLCAFPGFGRLNIKYFLKSKTLASTLCVLGFLGGVNPLKSSLEYR